MPFPYPENPVDWQTAYTREQAYRAFASKAQASIAAILLGMIVSGSYLALKTALFLSQRTQVAPYLGAAIVFLVYFICFIALAFMQLAASRFTATFIRAFYSLPDGINVERIIDYRLNGKLKLPPPLSMVSQFEGITVKDGEIEKAEQWPAWMAKNLGGPIGLNVCDGCALYLERGNQFSRVVGPGEKAPFLEWHETIKYVVDLSPKVKIGTIDVWTRDGIKVNLTIRIECRIGDPARKVAGSGLVYPYDPVAVKKAIERYSLSWSNPLEEPKESTWIDAAWGQARGIVTGYIGSRMLDDLLMADRKNGQILSPEAFKELVEKLNNATRKFGVFITDFQIQKFDIPQKIQEQQKEFWKAERMSIDTIIDGQAKAYSIRAREKARAQAQEDLILAIADGLDKNPNKQYTEPLLLSLSKILDSSLADSSLRASLAKDTLDTLEKLQKLLG
jgi:regulator of protease activity HflC (stomatin/prohibitin superfamily)